MEDDTFQDLFENIADDFCVLAEALVVTHDGKRVFPASTPSGLGIWSEATLGEPKYNFAVPTISPKFIW